MKYIGKIGGDNQLSQLTVSINSNIYLHVYRIQVDLCSSVVHDDISQIYMN